ncbi:response regulator, partial [Emergencia timonensis]
MIKILIAEDDRQLNEGIKLSLREEGRNFLQSYTLTEARTAVEEANPDLLILDVNFPDGSGLDLLREIKSAGRRTKIILLTAN